MFRSLCTAFAALLFTVLFASLLCSCRSEEEKRVETWPVPVTEEGNQRKIERRLDEAEKNKLLEFLHSLPDEPYRISANDVFDVNVYGYENLTALSILVTPDGYISMPLVGPCRIGGMTLVDATKHLTEKISKYVRDPKVSLIPRQVKGFTFTIGGRVEKPGRYPLIAGTKLQDAVADASGLSMGEFRSDTVELADLKNSYIIREGKRLPVDFEKALLRGDPLNNIPIRNGDYIYLPSSANAFVYVLGEVNDPRYVTYKEDMTILKSFTFTKGLKDSHSAWALVMRGSLSDHPIICKVNINLILQGKAEDFPLLANDMVFVPKSGIEAYNYYIGQLMPTVEFVNLLTGPFSNAALYFGLR